MGPEERVTSFIAGYLRAHEQIKSEDFTARPTEEFDRWKALVTELDAEHAVDRGCMPLAGVMHGRSPHDPDVESIIGVRYEGGTAFVETRAVEILPNYFEYEMVQLDGDWRIRKIWVFLVPADAPLVHERDRARFEEPPIFPVRDLPADDANANGDAIFVSGREVPLGGSTCTIEVRPVGRLAVTSGRLAVGDLGYDAGMLGVLGLAVPPGEYPAEVAASAGRVAALRVRFADRPIVRWVPADHNGAKPANYVVGVDAGNVAIMDLSAVTGVKSRDKERAFEAFAENGAQRHMMLSLVHENDTVISDSGWGDGGYPVYWGLDAKDRPVSLVVDFLLFPRAAAPGAPSKGARPWWKIW